jgi:hypothetical protein
VPTLVPIDCLGLEAAMSPQQQRATCAGSATGRQRSVRTVVRGGSVTDELLRQPECFKACASLSP